MVIALNTHTNGNGNHRLLKHYERQVECLRKGSLFLLAELKKRAFEEQAEALGKCLRILTDPPVGNISVVTCLPFGSLKKRMHGLICGKHRGICDCKLGSLQTKYPPNSLYALVGVNEGRERRVHVNGNGTTAPTHIQGLVEPEQAFTAWAAVDMALLYPSLLKQHGLIAGQTALGSAASALWLYRGLPFFGSTCGEAFQRSVHCRWGVPSYQMLVTI